MSLYAESSAVLAWLLDEPSSARMREILAGDRVIITSDLTLIECDRVLWRAVMGSDLSEIEAADRRAQLMRAASHWHVLRIGPSIVERARQPFGREPIRTLDAIHLASLIVARSSVSGLALLSLDERVRRAALALGIEVLPSTV